MKALVVTIEGLGCGMVGAYGAATCVTPAFDRLASRSALLDQCIVDSPQLETQLTSLWTATHAAVRGSALSEWTLWRALEAQSRTAHLITDSRRAANVAEQLGCPRITLVEPESNAAATDDVEACGLMSVFAEALEVLASPESQGLIWIHSQGLTLPWDAPTQLRHSFMDPEDPEPPADVCVPAVILDEEADPDLAIGWGQVAAAQVAVVDEALDAIDQTLSARDDAEDWAVMIVGLGGIPLGEHGQIGRVVESVTTESHQAPAIIRRPHAPPIGSRQAELCQLPDLVPSLLDATSSVDATAADLLNASPGTLWGRSMLSNQPPTSPSSWPPEHTTAWLVGDTASCLRTPAWELIARKSDDDSSEPQLELYVKPDDRWEANDVVSRRRDIALRLYSILQSLPQLTAACDRSALPKLDGELTDLVR